MQEINNFAPVLIPTLNRITHFKRCVESLSKCTYADQTDLYIALDYPLKESHWEGYNDICNYINEINGFKTIIIIRRERNFGGVDNLFDAQKTIFEKYGRMILSEDDNEFSPNFLAFVNWGLEKYKDDEKVFSVCGYNYPIDMSGYDKDYYFANEFSAWGCGIWKDKWEPVSKNVLNKEYTLKILTSSKRTFLIIRKRIGILYALIISAKKNVLLGDASLTAYFYFNNIYCVFPKISKVRNFGHDGSGMHCKKENNELFLNQKIDKNLYFDNKDILTPYFDVYVNNKLKKYFMRSIFYKIPVLLLYFYHRISNIKL